MASRNPALESHNPLPTEAPRSQDSTQGPWSTPDPNAIPTSPWDDAPQYKPYNGQQNHDQQLLDVPDALRPGGPGGASFTSNAPSMGSTPPQSRPDDNAWHASRSYTASPASFQPPQPPAPLQTANLTGTSDSLRPDMNPSPGGTETNPFKRKALSQSSNQSSSLDANLPAGQQAAPPTQAFGDMSLAEGSGNPWQQDPIQAQRTGTSTVPTPPPFPTDMGPEPEDDPWRAGPTSQQPNRPASPTVLSISSGRASPAWDDLPENQTKQSHEAPHMSQETERDINQDRNAWDDGLVGDKGKNKAMPPVPGQSSQGEAAIDDWSLIDPGAAPPTTTDSKQGVTVPSAQAQGKVPEVLVDFEGHDAGQATEPAPSLPPRPRYSPRPVDSKSETYQIKKINWHDHQAASNPRTSPILVQNENGPCPLVALVNALVLTTPAELTDTALVQVLRSREQISLGLLLDAVFDELMSSRRTGKDAALPDVGELYDFMKGLHTGMNVNPRFVPSDQVVEAFRKTSLTHLDPSERGDLIPGTFEDTVEMELYSAFSIPLIHGWLPTRDDPAYDAFSRQANSYDYAQNLLFREEELEHKLSRPEGQGLTEDEQQLYQDIITIRSFLESSATQLTPRGLEVITQAMRPGLVAILFRNDHFSTLYRHPQTKQLLALVTDAGYSSHAEVVWESLTDVNGIDTVYLSGDFKLVGGPEASKTTNTGEREWFEDAPSSSQTGAALGHARSTSQGAASDADRVQEDHDLALAMQMQEEEDERHRAEQARRARERELSEHFIEQQAQQGGSSGARPGQGTQYGRNGSFQGTGGAQSGQNGSYQGPGGSQSLAGPRVSSSSAGLSPSAATGRRPSTQSTTQQVVRPLVPPTIPQRRTGVARPAEDGLDDAPPTYEQAQNSTPYNPPLGHPSHPTSDQAQAQAQAQAQTEGVTGQGASPAAQAGSGQYPGARPGMGGPGMGGPGRMRPMAPGHMQSVSGRERDCVLM